MDGLLGTDLIDCAGDNLAAIAPMVIFPASADKRVVTRYGEVTSASFARPGSATYTAASGEVEQVGVDVPRVGSTGWILEGSATNKVTCAKSNPQDLTNTNRSGEASAVISVVNDAAQLAAMGFSAFGSNVYKIDNSAGSTSVWLWFVGQTGNTNQHSRSLIVRVATGTARMTWSNDSGNGPLLANSNYIRICDTFTPAATTHSLTIKALPNSVVYCVMPQLEEGPVCTSPIPGGTGAITRASEGADTSGNGLSIPLSRAMLDSLTGELSDWTAAWSHVSGTAPTYSGGNKISTYSAQTSTDYHALLTAGVSVGDKIEVSYTIAGYTGGTFQLGFGSGSMGEARSANGAYTERGTLTTDTNLYAIATGLTGTVTINYCRRVLDSGQTNPGEGTVLCGVYLPWWVSGIVPIGMYPSVIAFTNNSQAPLCFTQVPGTSTMRAQLWDGVTFCTVDLVNFQGGKAAFLMQWSAALGRMRIGIYNPATGALTWSSYATYSGFFPIHASNQLCFFYGGGNFPIYVVGLRWPNSIVSDAECVRLSKEMLP